MQQPFDDDEEMMGPMNLGPVTPNMDDISGIGPGHGVLQRDSEKKNAQIEDLYGWTDKFEYQPGVQYVRVSRAYPKVWEGIPIAGVIEDMIEPFDTDYLMETWGGGTYKLSAIQLDPDGKSRTVDRKTITISGLPYAFKGQDGTPHPLPQSKHLRDEMRYRRERQDEGMDDGFRQAETVTAADLYNIASNQNQSQYGGAETLDVLRNAQNDVQNHMQRAMEQQAQLHQSTIQSQREEMRLMRERISDQQNQAQAPFQHAMSMMENRGNIEMQMMRSQLDAMRSEHSNQMQMMQNEHARVIESLQRETDRMRDDARMREENIRTAVAGQYQGQIAALEHRVQMSEQSAQNQIMMARQDADRREGQLKMLLEANHNTQFTLMASERDRLASDLSSTKDELTSYRQVVMEKQDPIASMQRMQGLIEAVQGFSGGGGPEGPEIPGDFLGKVAHYGPGLAKNFLGPILSRVDSATAVAKQAVDMQQSQQQQMPPQYFSQMPPQQLSAPPQPMPQMYDPNQMQGAYMGPEMPDVPQFDPSQVQGAPTPPQTPQQDPLVVFLEQQLQANTTPEQTVELLDQAIDRQEIAPESILEFVDTADSEVIQTLTHRAMDAGLSTLPTPRGRHFMESVLSKIGEKLSGG